MSTSEAGKGLRLGAAACALALLCIGAAGAQQRYGLGQPLTQKEIAGWDIDVKADGAGLPPGSGTATRGTAIYTQQCVACHGVKGAGGLANKLAGGFGTLNTPGAQKTIGSFWPYSTTVFDYVRRAMPHNAPQSLSADQVYSLTAYLLNLNGIVGENEEMNADTLPKVKMPNRGGFKPVVD
jgi:S-disulfanyl-L-cysteine oxidoreductase SoxD